jgi:hypothetical protein
MSITVRPVMVREDLGDSPTQKNSYVHLGVDARQTFVWWPLRGMANAILRSLNSSGVNAGFCERDITRHKFPLLRVNTQLTLATFVASNSLQRIIENLPTLLSHRDFGQNQVSGKLRP